MFIFTMQVTPNDFNNYLPVFQNMLTSFKAPATSVNTTTLASKTATIVNQTTIQKTPAPLLNGAGRSSNLNRFHNQSLYTSHLYFIPPSSNSNGLHNRALSTSRTYFAHPPYSTSSSNISSVVNSNNKAIMLGFDDGWKSQITYAKSILDKYGFKASFFVVCNYVNS